MAEEQDYSDLLGQVKNIRRMQKERAFDLATKIPARGMYRAAGYTPAQLEALAPMPGKFLPSDAATYNKGLLEAFNELTAASANPDAGEEERMKQKVAFLKVALQQGVEVMNKRAQLGTDVEKARLRAQVDRTKETIDALDKAEGVTSSGRTGKSEQRKGAEAAGSLIKQVGDANIIKRDQAVGGTLRLESREAIESYKKNLEEGYRTAYGNLNKEMPDEIKELFVDEGVIDQQAKKMAAQGLLSAPGSSSGSITEEDEAYREERFRGGGLKAREEELARLQQEINNINAVTGGALDAQMQQVAQGATRGRTGDILEAADIIVGTGMSPEDKKAFQESVGSKQAELIDMMLKPGAEGPIKQAKLDLMQDPNFQKFKKDMGIQTDEFGLRALRKKYRTQNVADRGADRKQMKRIRELGTAAHPVRTAAIESVADTIEKRPVPTNDSAKIASETLDKRDVTVKTEGIGGSDAV